MKGTITITNRNPSKKDIQSYVEEVAQIYLAEIDNLLKDLSNEIGHLGYAVHCEINVTGTEETR